MGTRKKLYSQRSDRGGFHKSRKELKDDKDLNDWINKEMEKRGMKRP